jgi:hypothetical protein
MPRMARRGRRRRRRVRRRRILLVGGLVAFGTYKFSTRDADRIQEHTGTDPEEMDDAELEQAMQDLNIDPQKVTSADTEQGGQAPASAPVASSGGSGGYLDELTKLAALHESGVLTDDEFAAKKKQILDLN